MAFLRRKAIEEITDFQRLWDEERQMAKKDKWLQIKTLSKDEFFVIREIGKGFCGQVQLVKNRRSGHLYAMKSVSRLQSYDTEEIMYYLNRERTLLKEVNSVWVMRMYHSFQDSQFNFLVLEYIPGGSLKNVLEQEGFLLEYQVKHYGVEMLMAINVIHRHGFMHRNIQPSSFLIDAQGHLKIMDFGHSVRFLPVPICQKLAFEASIKEGKPFITEERRKRIFLYQRKTSEKHVDSVSFTAPEVLRPRPRGLMPYVQEPMTYSFACDFWSLGVVLYQLLFGLLPFQGATLNEVKQQILDWRKHFRFPIVPPVSVEARDLIQRLLCDEPSRLGQYGCEDVMSHIFFADTDWRSLRYDPVPVPFRKPHSDKILIGRPPKLIRDMLNGKMDWVPRDMWTDISGANVEPGKAPLLQQRMPSLKDDTIHRRQAPEVRLSATTFRALEAKISATNVQGPAPRRSITSLHGPDVRLSDNMLNRLKLTPSTPTMQKSDIRPSAIRQLKLAMDPVFGQYSKAKSPNTKHLICHQKNRDHHNVSGAVGANGSHSSSLDSENYQLGNASNKWVGSFYQGSNSCFINPDLQEKLGLQHHRVHLPAKRECAPSDNLSQETVDRQTKASTPDITTSNTALISGMSSPVITTSNTTLKSGMYTPVITTSNTTLRSGMSTLDITTSSITLQPGMSTPDITTSYTTLKPGMSTPDITTSNTTLKPGMSTPDTTTYNTNLQGLHLTDSKSCDRFTVFPSTSKKGVEKDRNIQQKERKCVMLTKRGKCLVNALLSWLRPTEQTVASKSKNYSVAKNRHKSQGFLNQAANVPNQTPAGENKCLTAGASICSQQMQNVGVCIASGWHEPAVTETTSKTGSRTLTVRNPLYVAPTKLGSTYLSPVSGRRFVCAAQLHSRTGLQHALQDRCVLSDSKVGPVYDNSVSPRKGISATGVGPNGRTEHGCPPVPTTDVNCHNKHPGTDQPGSPEPFTQQTEKRDFDVDTFARMQESAADNERTNQAASSSMVDDSLGNAYSDGSSSEMFNFPCHASLVMSSELELDQAMESRSQDEVEQMSLMNVSLDNCHELTTSDTREPVRQWLDSFNTTSLHNGKAESEAVMDSIEMTSETMQGPQPTLDKERREGHGDQTASISSFSFSSTCIAYSAPKQWNSLPFNIRNMLSTHAFKKSPKNSPLQTALLRLICLLLHFFPLMFSVLSKCVHGCKYLYRPPFPGLYIVVNIAVTFL